MASFITSAKRKLDKTGLTSFLSSKNDIADSVNSAQKSFEKLYTVHNPHEIVETQKEDTEQNNDTKHENKQILQLANTIDTQENINHILQRQIQKISSNIRVIVTLLFFLFFRTLCDYTLHSFLLLCVCKCVCIGSIGS